MEMDFSILTADEILGNLYKCFLANDYDYKSTSEYIDAFFAILKEGGTFTLALVKHELNEKGFDGSILNSFMLESALEILKKEFKYKISEHTMH